MADEKSQDPMPRMGVDIAQIRKDLSVDRPTVSEDIFIQRLLPLFIRRADETVDIGVWMEYANTMTTSLDVVDASGEIIFTAPSPLRPVIQLHKRNDEQRMGSLMNIVERAKAKSNVHPNLGEAFLQNELDALELIRDLDDSWEKDWVKIMQRYNYLPSEDQKEELEAKAKTPTQSQTVFSDQDEDF